MKPFFISLVALKQINVDEKNPEAEIDKGTN